MINSRNRNLRIERTGSQQFNQSDLEPNLSSSSQHQKLDFEQPKTNDPVTRLYTGATLISTSIGYILFGIPPGTLTEIRRSLKIESMPQYFIIPTLRFHKRHALNLAEFQQMVIQNYLKNQKSYIICTQLVAENLRNVFAECYPKWTQDNFNETTDFYSSIDKNPVPNFAKEREFFMKQLADINILFEQQIEFLYLDKKNCKLPRFQHRPASS